MDRRLKALATTRERAETLFADGYRIDPVPGRPGHYYVARPTPRVDKKTGEITEGYRVTLSARGVTCECPQFHRSRECKHGIATRKAVVEALRLAGPFLPAGATVPGDFVAPPAHRWQEERNS